MYLKATLSAGLLSLPLALAAIHEQLSAAPAGWTHTSTPSSTQSITLSIAMQQQNIAQLESMIAKVSTLGSASYGKYLDMEEVNALFAPSNQSVSAVMAWLSKAGINATTDGDYVDLTTTVGTANSILGANFLNYQDTTGVSKLRTLQYSVPDSLSSHIDLITPTTFFGRTTTKVAPLGMKKRHAPKLARKVPPQVGSKHPLAIRETPSQINATCLLYNVTGYTTLGPECFKLIYNVSYTPDPASGSKIGFGSFLNESAQYEDLFTYEKVFGIPAQNFSVVLINGGTNNQNASTAQYGEANLDVQNIIGISHPLPVTEFITGGSPPFIPNLDEPTAADNENEPYLNYYQYLLSQPNSALPQVISNSYGDDEQTVPERYAKRVCNQIGFMGLRGFTILESSGDTGVGGPCQSNDGKNTSQFTPTFPGTCPYITAVGGTQSLEPEVAWDSSSGGFSNYFGRAWYQTQAIKHYLNDEISNTTKVYYKPYTNFKGRGFPDVSAHSLRPE